MIDARKPIARHAGRSFESWLDRATAAAMLRALHRGGWVLWQRRSAGARCYSVIDAHGAISEFSTRTTSR
jgi:hypothetical protein